MVSIPIRPIPREQKTVTNIEIALKYESTLKTIKEREKWAGHQQESQQISIYHV